MIAPMKFLVFGAQGYFGQQFLERFPGSVGSTVDIANMADVASELDTHQPDIVINAAGKTGRPNIDWCEDHKLETIHSNVTGPLVLLKECGNRGIYWVHLGSGCIYSGDNGGRGFTEEDPPNFAGSFYSRTKAWIDRMLSEFTEQGILVLRLRMPFDGTPAQRSLITKLAKYGRVLDAQNSMTYLPDFFDAVTLLTEKRTTGIFNMVNEGSISPYRIMELYRQIVDPAHEFARLALDDLPEVAKAGRSTCVLSTAKLRATGVRMRPVDDAVQEALQNLLGTRPAMSW